MRTGRKSDLFCFGDTNMLLTIYAALLLWRIDCVVESTKGNSSLFRLHCWRLFAYDTVCVGFSCFLWVYTKSIAILLSIARLPFLNNITQVVHSCLLRIQKRIILFELLSITKQQNNIKIRNCLLGSSCELLSSSLSSIKLALPDGKWLPPTTDTSKVTSVLPANF